MALNRSRDFCANFAQLLRNTTTDFAPPKLCLGKMSDSKLPVLHQRHSCVHHYRRQMAATGQRQKASYCGKFVAAFCRFLPLRFCPVFFTTISLGDGVYPQTGFPSRPLHHHLSPALNVCNCPAWMVRGRGRGRGRFAAGLAKRFAPWLATAGQQGSQHWKQHGCYHARQHPKHHGWHHSWHFTKHVGWHRAKQPTQYETQHLAQHLTQHHAKHFAQHWRSTEPLVPLRGNACLVQNELPAASLGRDSASDFRR
jgi:hypothetical protein